MIDDELFQKIKKLKEIKKIDYQINFLIYEKDNVNLTFEKCVNTTAGYNNDGVTNGTKNNTVENNFLNYITTVEEYEKKINETVDLLYSLKQKYQKAIFELEKPEQQIILFKHFFEYKTFKNIAREINYSISHTKRIYRDAIEKLKI